MKNKTQLRTLNCLLVEDEQHDIDTIVRFIENHERLHHVATTTKMNEFSRITSFNEIDIIFLDNKLGEAPHQRNQGLDYLDTLITYKSPSQIPYIISISQFPEDYQKALDLNVWSVISKPFNEENFRTKVGRVIEIIDDKDEIKRLKEITDKGGLIPSGRILVKEKGTNQKCKAIDLNNIAYIESGPNAHDIIIHLAEPHGDSILTTDTNFATLEGFLAGRINDEKQLTPKQLKYFGRIKKNCIINLYHIDSTEGNMIYLKNIEKPFAIVNSQYKDEISKRIREIH
jgi:DNA-binding LytR/AlgR family response regulator